MSPGEIENIFPQLCITCSFLHFLGGGVVAAFKVKQVKEGMKRGLVLVSESVPTMKIQSRQEMTASSSAVL